MTKKEAITILADFLIEDSWDWSMCKYCNSVESQVPLQHSEDCVVLVAKKIMRRQ